jgi:hypothetical protein
LTQYRAQSAAVVPMDFFSSISRWERLRECTFNAHWESPISPLKTCSLLSALTQIAADAMSIARTMMLEHLSTIRFSFLFVAAHASKPDIVTARR